MKCRISTRLVGLVASAWVGGLSLACAPESLKPASVSGHLPQPAESFIPPNRATVLPTEAPPPIATQSPMLPTASPPKLIAEPISPPSPTPKIDILGSRHPSPYPNFIPPFGLPAQSRGAIGQALGGAKLEIAVENVSGSPVIGAVVAIFGAGLAYAPTASDGLVRFESLPLGDYLLEVSSTGYLPATSGVSLRQARTTQQRVIRLVGSERVVSGTIRDTSGKPVPWARVSANGFSILSSQEGDYEYPALSSMSLEIRKIGFNLATSTGGEVILNPKTAALSFENRPFGEDPSLAFSKLVKRLAAMGWRTGENLAGADVRCWIAPTRGAKPNTSEAQSYVRDGGKLVVMGDWLGSRGYSPTVVNQLLLPLGVAILPNLVRHVGSDIGIPEWLSAVILGHQAFHPLQRVELLGASSIAAAPPAFAFAWAPSGSLRVQTLEIPLAAARLVGNGAVMVLGDTSAWLDADIDRAENADFLERVLTW